MAKTMKRIALISVIATVFFSILYVRTNLRWSFSVSITFKTAQKTVRFARGYSKLVAVCKDGELSVMIIQIRVVVLFTDKVRDS